MPETATGLDFAPSPSGGFTLAGIRMTVVASPPSGVLVDLANAISTDERGHRTYNGPAMLRFILAAVSPADHAILRDVMASKNRVVDQHTAGRLVMWLAEEVTGHSFGAARALTHWAAQNWSYLRGCLLIAGAPVVGYSARDVLDLAYARWVQDQIVIMGATVTEVRANLDRALAEAWVDRETHGMDVAVLDGIAPAKPRPRGPRPERPVRPSSGRRGASPPPSPG